MEYHLRAFKNHFTGSRYLDNLTGISNDYLLGRAEEELRYIIQEFCSRQLTKPSDRYAAISGILQTWGNTFKREHVVGIWTDEENWWKDVLRYVTDYGLPGVPVLNKTAVSTTSMPPGPASQRLDGPSWSRISVSGLISHPWEQNTRWGSRKYFVRSALLEATADGSVVSTQGRLMLREPPLQTHVQRKSWGRDKERGLAMHKIRL